MSKSLFNYVINTVAATAGDLTRPGNGLVLVTGDTVGFLRPKVSSISLKYFIAETLANIDVTVTNSLAANTQYRFVISQSQAGSMNGELPRFLTVDISFPSTPNATQAGNALAAAVQGFIDSGQLFATATAITTSNGGVTITGLATYGLVSVSQPINMTVTSQLASGASSAAGCDAVASTATLTVTLVSTAGVAVGQLHYITWTGAQLINGLTGTQGVILRVSAFTANTSIVYVATTISANIVNQTSTWKLLATEASGLGADIIAKRGISASGYPSVDIVATSTYHEVVVSGLTPSGSTLTVGDGSPFEKHYFISTVDAGSNSNALDLMTQFSYVEQYLNSAGTAADPLLL